MAIPVKIHVELSDISFNLENECTFFKLNGKGYLTEILFQNTDNYGYPTYKNVIRHISQSILHNYLSLFLVVFIFFSIDGGVLSVSQGYLDFIFDNLLNPYNSKCSGYSGY